jgi:hypothetical protein
MYVRFAISERDENSDQGRGVFNAIYDLEERGELEQHELAWFAEVEKWLDAHRRVPTKLTRSRRRSARNRAICWLKMAAVDHVSRMREAATMLEHHGVPVLELRTERPGYIVYEDEYQVAAIPFERETF